MKNQLKKLKIFIAGHNGMVGTALKNYLISNNVEKIITASRKDLDLQVEKDVEKFIKKNKPDIIINCAGKVGGILANSTYPTEFLYENIYIQTNLIKSAYKNKVKHFINLGSSCIYPGNSKQPIKEKYLLSSDLEKTNEAYALAKIVGLKACQFYNEQYNTDYFTLMPCNLYGPNDNFDEMTSHVIPGMISKFHKAKIENLNSVTLWGDGSPLREFLYVDDLADAIFLFINKKAQDFIYNVGSNDEVSILELAELISSTVEFKGEILWDSKYPNGTQRKKLDSQKINDFGFKPNYFLRKNGLTAVYNWFKNNY